MSGYNRLFAMVTEWQNEAAPPGEAPDWKAILDHLAYLERVKFQPFIPTLYSSRHPASFMDRLHVWINNPGLDEEDKRDLFRFAHQIAFFSFDDFVSLFRSAFAGPVTRWCMDKAGIQITSPDWIRTMEAERHQFTWYCPITDSLLISVFHHVNGIEGKDRKPSFRDLAEFGDGDLVRKHIAEKGYKRIVLLEDFVGTGTQSLKAVKWALRNVDVPILFCPILVASEALSRYTGLSDRIARKQLDAQQCSDFSWEPVFTLSSDCFIHDVGRESDELSKRIHGLAGKIHEKLATNGQEFARGALGFWNENSPQKGANVVMFSNSPNNSLPLIWHDAEGHWKSLFPRVARQPL